MVQRAALPVAEAQRRILARVPRLPAERIAIRDALGRVPAEPVIKSAHEPAASTDPMASPLPHSDPLARYQGGDVRTTTESTAATSADPLIGSSGDLEERNRDS